MAINNPMAQELMAKSPIPIPLQYVMLYLGLANEILSANFHVASRELGTPAIHRLDRCRVAGPSLDFAENEPENHTDI
jgi:hypothetical protein